MELKKIEENTLISRNSLADYYSWRKISYILKYWGHLDAFLAHYNLRTTYLGCTGKYTPFPSWIKWFDFYLKFCTHYKIQLHPCRFVSIRVENCSLSSGWKLLFFPDSWVLFFYFYQILPTLEFVHLWSIFVTCGSSAFFRLDSDRKSSCRERVC